jgi:hypothetical protein
LAFYSSKLQTAPVKIAYLLNRWDMNRRVRHVIKRTAPRMPGAQLPEQCKFVPGRHFFRDTVLALSVMRQYQHEHNLTRIPSVLKDLRPESFFTRVFSVHGLRWRRRASLGFRTPPVPAMGRSALDGFVHPGSSGILTAAVHLKVPHEIRYGDHAQA